MRRRMLVLLLALPVALPGGEIARAHSPNERLDELRSEIRQKRRQIRTADARQRSALASIRVSDSRREALKGEISDLASALAAARRRLAGIRAHLETARGELREWDRRLGASEARLFLEQETLGERAANAYKLGPSGYLDVVIGASSLRELTDRIQLMQGVLIADVAMVRSVETTRDLVAEQRGRVEDYREDLDRRQATAAREMRRVAKLKARREALRAQVEREIAAHETLVEEIQGTKAQYERAVASLQQESANVRAAIRGSGSSGSGRIGGQLAWPTPGPVVSGFGWRIHPIYKTKRFHAGIDIDGGCGQGIVAAAKGTVISAGWRGGYGKTTVIDHGSGLSTLYAHQSSIGVGAGQSVARGQGIGAVGTTGWSTGCHLHFEVRVNGEPVDPMSYL